MKYAEYQVWYHVYTSVAASMYNSSANHSQQGIIEKADAVANYAVDKFRSVEDLPQAPNLNLDVQGIVDKVLKDSGKKK